MKILAFAVVVAAAMEGRAHAGAPPDCKPPATAKSRVDKARVVVLASATSKTRVLRNGRASDRPTRTSFELELTLKGPSPKSRFVVHGCTHYKCGRSEFAKNERWILFLYEVEDGKSYQLEGWNCTGGMSSNSYRFAADASEVRAIFEAAGKELPRK